MRRKFAALAAACVALMVAACGPAAAAQNQPRLFSLAPSFAPQREGPPPGRPYFVDFRAGYQSITGHTYIVFGRLSADGHVESIQNADILPINQDAAVVGTLVPIRAQVQVRDGDSKRDVTIDYRRYLSAAEFSRMRAAIRHQRTIDRQWSLLLFNCNDFAGEIAEALGLRRPPGAMLPNMFVASLRLLNGRED
jgi:hypothetical protein